ncbi:MAG: aldehyde dehydrogenase, partial [Clostridia bacterium]|nr:aldehyde dehydrogenase [Clostridia bacterium]
LYAHKVAPALITGNAVIAKPASDTPLATTMLTELLLEAGVPGGVMQLITGSGREIGKWLDETKLVDAVSFTGSTEVGSSLLAGGAKEIRRTFLELGGNDPFVIFPDADLDLCVTEAIGGRAHNAGQVCCASKRYIVHESVKDAFADKLVKALSALKLGDPADPANDMGPLISEKAAKAAMDDIAHIIDQGATVLLGNKREGAYVWPTVLTDVSPDNDVARDLEVFAALFPIISFQTFDEALAIANQTSFGLASTVMTADMKTAMKFATKIQAGTCVINGTGDYRSVHQAFGGYKHSGLGREGTSTTLREVTQEKNIALKNILK